MKGFILAGSGWVTTIVALIFVFQQQQQLEKSTAAVATTQAALDSANARVTALEAQVAQLQQSAKAVEPAAENKSPKDLVKGLLGAVVDSAAKEIEAELAETVEDIKDSTSDNPFTGMFSGERGEQMMEAGISMSVDMQYAGFFADMNLTPEKETALREAIMAHQRAAGAGGMAMMRGEKMPDDWHAPTDEDLLASVKDLLTQEEYDAFAQYQEELPERMVRQQIESQLGMFAAGLSEESYATTVEVLVDKLAGVTEAQQELMNNNNPGEALAGIGQTMTQAYDDALTELEATLPEADLARVRRFVDQQRAMFEMFSNMENNDEAGKE